MDCIQKANPEAYAKRIKRAGVVNAWTDPAFAEAVRATGKKDLIVAGVTTDVCLVPPALSMQEEGFLIKVYSLLYFPVIRLLLGSEVDRGENRPSSMQAVPQLKSPKRSPGSISFKQVSQ